MSESNKIKLFEQRINENKGKPHNYPECMNYNIDGMNATIELNKGFTKKEFRRFDSWALAFITEAESELHINIKSVTFKLNKSIDQFKYDFESFRRRVSYLDINNEDISFNILVNNENIELYDKQNLFNRPAYERIRGKIEDRSDKDKGSYLEKAFQGFLYGHGLEKDNRTNDRLAILGEDFYKSKGKNHGILREFPTGVFKDDIKEECRVLPTEYVDIVTLNKYGFLSVIELKLDDEQLEVISQILDYALFFRCYIQQIRDLKIFKETFSNIKESDIYCYVVNNHYHVKFDKILKFYSTKDKNYGFELKKIILGYTTYLQ